jgi:hypothetical protein
LRGAEMHGMENNLQQHAGEKLPQHHLRTFRQYACRGPLWTPRRH